MRCAGARVEVEREREASRFDEATATKRRRRIVAASCARDADGPRRPTVRLKRSASRNRVGMVTSHRPLPLNHTLNGITPSTCARALPSLICGREARTALLSRPPLLLLTPLTSRDAARRIPRVPGQQHQQLARPTTTTTPRPPSRACLPRRRLPTTATKRAAEQHRWRVPPARASKRAASSRRARRDRTHRLAHRLASHGPRTCASAQGWGLRSARLRVC